MSFPSFLYSSCSSIQIVLSPGFDWRLIIFYLVTLLETLLRTFQHFSSPNPQNVCGKTQRRYSLFFKWYVKREPSVHVLKFSMFMGINNLICRKIIVRISEIDGVFKVKIIGKTISLFFSPKSINRVKRIVYSISIFNSQPQYVDKRTKTSCQLTCIIFSKPAAIDEYLRGKFFFFLKRNFFL